MHRMNTNTNATPLLHHSSTQSTIHGKHAIRKMLDKPTTATLEHHHHVHIILTFHPLSPSSSSLISLIQPKTKKHEFKRDACIIPCNAQILTTFDHRHATCVSGRGRPGGTEGLDSERNNVQSQCESNNVVC